MAEYLADKHAMRERTAKLRALRLARDAANHHASITPAAKKRSAWSSLALPGDLSCQRRGLVLSVRPDAIAPPFRNRPVLCSDRRGARASGIAPVTP